jgi:hypothetical protein
MVCGAHGLTQRLIRMFLCVGLPILLFAGSAFGTDYYLSATGSDNNNGLSASAPWATFAYADAHIAPGDTVHVLPGTYTSAVTVSTSGTATARITWISDTKWAAKFVIEGVADSCFYGTGSYVDYVGFDITENPTSGSCRIGLRDDGGFTTVQKNRVHDLNRDSNVQTCSSLGGAGILVTSQASGLDTATVNANLVDNVGGQQSSFETHTCVHIHNYYLSMSNLTVTNNISLRALGYGYSFGGHPPAQVVTHYIAVNNAAINSGYGAFYLKSDAAANDVANNNLVDQRTNGVVGFSSLYTSGTTAISNNLVYMPNGGTAYENCSSGCTVLKPVSGDPLFVSYTGDATGDYHLQSGSPAIDAGTATDAPATDFDGNPRPQGAGYDIGPYEFGSGSGTIDPPTKLTAVVH